MRTLVQTVTDAFDLAYRKARPDLINQFWNVNDVSLFDFMKAAGGFESVVGGDVAYRGPIEITDTSNLTWLQKGEAMELQSQEFTDQVEYDWKYAASPVVVHYADMQKITGDQALVNYVETLLKNNMTGIKRTMETVLFSANTGTLKQPIGLQAIVNTTPTNSVGGLTGSTANNWQNDVYDFTANYGATLADWQTDGHNALREVIQGLPDMPSVIVMPQNLYNGLGDMFQQAFVVNYDASNQVREIDIVKGGFQFDGIPVIWSTQCPANKAYVLNMDHLKFRYHMDDLLRQTDWTNFHDVPEDMVSYIRVTGNLTCTKRSSQAVITNIATA